MIEPGALVEPLITVLVPCYEMGGLGGVFLRRLLTSLENQTFRDFEVLIVDSSPEFGLQEICGDFPESLRLRYLPNPRSRGNPSANLNFGMENARGRYIKFLFQDDYMSSNRGLQQIASGLEGNTHAWLVTGTVHTRDGRRIFRRIRPKLNPMLYLGENTIGSPSAVAVLRHNSLRFDEKLIWLMDVDFYHRCSLAHGPPKVVRSICVVNQLGDHQVTNTIANEDVRSRDMDIVRSKFGQLPPPGFGVSVWRFRKFVRRGLGRIRSWS